MQTKAKSHLGMTLVELIVATALFMSIVVVISMTIAATFDSYVRNQSNVSIEQDAQYIVARLSYAASQSDSNIILYQDTLEDFDNAGFVNTSVNSGGSVVLSNGSSGTYESNIVTLDASKTLASVDATTSGTGTVTYEAAMWPKVSGVCPTSGYTYYTFPNSSQTISGECFRYKAIFNGTNPSLDKVIYRTK